MATTQTTTNKVLRRLYIATALCTVFLIVEAIGGYLAGSIAILSDAAHLFADLAAFAVAIGASHLAQLPSSSQHTFGLKRMESLAALLSMVSLALVCVGLAWEATRRLFFSLSDKGDVDGALMSAIAAIGVGVNVSLALVLGPEHHVHMPGGSHSHHDHSHDHQNDDDGSGVDHSHDHDNYHETEDTPLLNHHHPDETDCDPEHHHHGGAGEERNVNLQAAYLHVMGDLAQSVAVLIAGIVIWLKPAWKVVDPIITLLFCGLVFYSTLSVIRGSIAVLLEEVPPHVSWNQVHDNISAVPGVHGVHDLHIWSISDGVPALSVHCFVEPAVGNDNMDQALKDIYAVCHRLHGIQHATVQLQSGDASSTACDCVTCQDLVTTNKCASPPG